MIEHYAKAIMQGTLADWRMAELLDAPGYIDEAES
jgi:hypothetical protein